MSSQRLQITPANNTVGMNFATISMSRMHIQAGELRKAEEEELAGKLRAQVQQRREAAQQKMKRRAKARVRQDSDEEVDAEKNESQGAPLFCASAIIPGLLCSYCMTIPCVSLDCTRQAQLRTVYVAVPSFLQNFQILCSGCITMIHCIVSLAHLWSAELSLQAMIKNIHCATVLREFACRGIERC